MSAAAASSAAAVAPPSLPPRYRVTPLGHMLADDNSFQLASIAQQCMLLTLDFDDATMHAPLPDDSPHAARPSPPAAPLRMHAAAGARLRHLLYARTADLLSPSLRPDSPQLVGCGPPSDAFAADRRSAIRCHLRVIRRLEAEAERERAKAKQPFQMDFLVELSHIGVAGNQADESAMAAALAATEQTEPQSAARLAALEAAAAFAWQSDSARREAAEEEDGECDECATREAVVDIRAAFGVDQPEANGDARCPRHAAH